jgi:hypothetical protein
MTHKIVLFITLLSYTVLASQAFMYILALKNTQMALDGYAYTQVRQLIDANMQAILKYVIYAALAANLLLVILSGRTPGSVEFITALIALLLLITDILLTLKGNVPLNQIINSWTPTNPPADWRDIRDNWFRIFRYRQIAIITGMISLLAGVVYRHAQPTKAGLSSLPVHDLFR